MNNKKKLRILVSVFDKTGIIEFISKLKNIFDLEIISTGGTAKHLINAGYKVITVEQITKFPEILSGRVKTLHPKIFGAILADNKNTNHLKQLEKFRIKPIDLVIVNLYPFEKTIKTKEVTLAKAIEQIDIGGVSLLRASAKNFQSIIVVCSIKDYLPLAKILVRKKSITLKIRKKLAQKTFRLTSNYDNLIAHFLD